MVNMHHLINSHRPHQTRESLISLMREQLSRRTAETARIEEATANAQSIVKRFKSLAEPLQEREDDMHVQKVENGNHQEHQEEVHDRMLFERLAGLA